MFERHVLQIEMHTFEQDVSGYERLFLPEIKHGSVVTNALQRGRILRFDIFGEA